MLLVAAQQSAFLLAICRNEAELDEAGLVVTWCELVRQLAVVVKAREGGGSFAKIVHEREVTAGMKYYAYYVARLDVTCFYNFKI